MSDDGKTYTQRLACYFSVEMGFKTQRQYQTSIKSYEDVKEAARKNKEQVIKCDLTPEKEKGNFTFYLKKYPNVRIQITSKRHILKLHGLKPQKLVLDLKVIRELASLLSESYPCGIDFKLDKEDISWHDKDEVIDELEGIIDFHRYLDELKRLGKFKDFVEDIWKDIDDDAVLHKYFAERANNFFARVLCEEGFRCKPDGSIRFHANKPPSPFLKHSTEILLKSGFL